MFGGYGCEKTFKFDCKQRSLERVDKHNAQTIPLIASQRIDSGICFSRKIRLFVGTNDIYVENIFGDKSNYKTFKSL